MILTFPKKLVKKTQNYQSTEYLLLHLQVDKASDPIIQVSFNTDKEKNGLVFTLFHMFKTSYMKQAGKKKQHNKQLLKGKASCSQTS